MKIASTTILIAGLVATSASVQTAVAADPNRPIVLTGNFQMQVPMDPAASTADVVNALTQANSALGDLMGKQCALLSDAFKRDCRVTQINLGSNYSDNTARFVQQGNYQAPTVGNANLNVTFQLAPRAEPAKP